MANDFIVEFTEDGQRKRERAQIGNFDGDVKKAQETIERIWGGAMPDRSDVKVICIAGAGKVDKVDLTGPSSPQNDASIIAKGLRKTGDA